MKWILEWEDLVGSAWKRNLAGNNPLGGWGRKLIFGKYVVLPFLYFKFRPLGRIDDKFWEEYLVRYRKTITNRVEYFIESRVFFFSFFRGETKG